MGGDRQAAARIAWVLEPNLFGDGDAPLADAARRAGHEVVWWSDHWWSGRGWPALDGRRVLFRGSLENARRVRAELAWSPGALCDVDAFACSTWYPRAAEWLLQRAWRLTTARALADDPRALIAALGDPARVFVRPDSPLKPFSGRVLARDGLTLGALDYGVYFDDPELPVIAAPARAVGREWRYVIVAGRVVAGSGYSAQARAHVDGAGAASGAPWDFAADVAARLAPPEPVYVLDVAECDGALRLVELNPFSGADLYGCDAAAIVAAVVAWLG